MQLLQANRIAPDGTPRSAASHLGLFCLPMSHKRDARLKLVKRRDAFTRMCNRFSVNPMNINQIALISSSNVDLCLFVIPSKKSCSVNVGYSQ